MKVKDFSILKVCSFTQSGSMLSEKIKNILQDVIVQCHDESTDLNIWIEDAFRKSVPVLFIGACGIAVRKISPFVKDKFSDSPVLVMDEAGQFVISVLSGHIGNGNRIAEIISEKINAVPVITTATDLNGKFSIDVFAKMNGFRIINRSGIKDVSAKILNDETLTMKIQEGIFYDEKNIPSQIKIVDYAEPADIVISRKACEEDSDFLINLVPRKYCLGLGCKKDKGFDELKDFILKTFHEKNLSSDEIYSLATIDLKEKETGLLELSHFFHVPFCSYSAWELNQVKGDFSESDFVKEITGVSNVCERAAVLSAGPEPEIILHKTSENGMTLSVAERKPEIKWWNK